MTRRRTSWTDPPRRGFTLAELVVVLAIIMLVAGLTLPGIIRIFNSGADQQAYNLVSGQLASARAYAVQNRTYAGVHYQLADPASAPGRKDRCYGQVVKAVCIDTNGDGKTDQVRFVPADGFAPQALPYPMVIGQVEDRFLTPGKDAIVTTLNNDEDMFNDFTTCTVVFDSAGRLVGTVRSEAGPDEQVIFDDTLDIFNNTKGRLYLWLPTLANDTLNTEDVNLGKRGAPSLLLFNIDDSRKSPFGQATYLNRYGRVLAINTYTGQLMGRN